MRLPRCEGIALFAGLRVSRVCVAFGLLVSMRGMPPHPSRHVGKHHLAASPHRSAIARLRSGAVPAAMRHFAARRVGCRRRHSPPSTFGQRRASCGEARRRTAGVGGSAEASRPAAARPAAARLGRNTSRRRIGGTPLAPVRTALRHRLSLVSPPRLPVLRSTKAQDKASRHRRATLLHGPPKAQAEACAALKGAGYATNSAGGRGASAAGPEIPNEAGPRRRAQRRGAGGEGGIPTRTMRPPMRTDARPYAECGIAGGAGRRRSAANAPRATAGNAGNQGGRRADGGAAAKNAPPKAILRLPSAARARRMRRKLRAETPPGISRRFAGTGNGEWGIGLKVGM